MGAVLGDPPFVLGWDVSGQVVACGAGVTRFCDGDEVVGLVRFPRLGGTYAEYVTAPYRHLAHKPAQISHIEAAGMPLAGLTAWQALVDVAAIEPRDRVLIHAAGGVWAISPSKSPKLEGHLCVQPHRRASTNSSETWGLTNWWIIAPRSLKMWWTTST